MIQAGDNVLWKGQGFIFNILSFILGLMFPEWRKRKWKPWHVGYVVKVYADGMIVVCEAIAKGIEYVTYSSIWDMGDYRIYYWLDNPNPNKIKKYASQHIGLPYDSLAYVWTILGGLSMKLFKHPFRIVNKPKMCWENLCEFDRFMGKQLQPAHEPCLINRMIEILERGH